MQRDIADAVAPGLARRLAAMFYDSWLIAAIWLLGATADTLIRAAAGWNAADSRWLLQAYLLVSPAVFFGWFWTHGGQTLGMRAWRLVLLDQAGRQVTWRQALIRYGAAWLSLMALGLGFLWILFDRQRRAWHDHLSGTRLLLVERETRAG